MRALILAAILLPLSALAQQPPGALETLTLDWQATLSAQAHLLSSLNVVITKLNAAEARVKELEAENAKLKAEKSE